MSDPAYDLYKKARNRLRRIQPIGFVNLAVHALHRVHVEGIETIKTYQPWNVLLSIKWALQEADATSHRRAPASLNDFHFIVNILHELGNVAHMPNEHNHVTLFLRKLAFQQFALLQGPDGSAVARQVCLFADLSEEHPMQKEFLRLSGVSIREFCVLSCGLLTLALQEPSPKAVDPVGLLKLESPSELGSVARFVRHLSKIVPELYEWFNAKEFKGDVADQRILPSPLIDAPLLAVNPRQFIVYYIPLLIRSLESVIYRTLRREDPAAFGDQFGPIFERYVTRCLDCAGVKYLNEAQMQAALPGTGKCVDFFVSDDDCNILIDSKAVEMSALGRVSYDAGFLLRALKASTSAMAQGLATHRRIISQTTPPKISYGKSQTFLVIVTFDDLYLGSSQDFLAIFRGTTLLTRLTEQFGSPLSIPLENMFFLSIREFEDLLEAIRAGKTGFSKALLYAQEQDSNPQSKKFQFKQHLSLLCPPTTRLPIADKAISELQEECVMRLKKSGVEED